MASRRVAKPTTETHCCSSFLADGANRRHEDVFEDVCPLVSRPLPFSATELLPLCQSLSDARMQTRKHPAAPLNDSTTGLIRDWRCASGRRKRAKGVILIVARGCNDSNAAHAFRPEFRHWYDLRDKICASFRHKERA